MSSWGEETDVLPPGAEPERAEATRLTAALAQLSPRFNMFDIVAVCINCVMLAAFVVICWPLLV